ncbi:nuclear transport factor 2 family protein [Burkholderia stagnalis]
MSETHAALITRFYEAFQQLDAETMSGCYAGNAVFSDPAFGELHGAEIGDMWRMLAQRAQGFSLVFDHVVADGQTGSAHWIANYVFTQSGNRVVNDIQARFVFADGLIVEHRDSFDLWRWSRQALGAKGTLLGWTPFVQNAIRQQARKGLAAFRAKRG